MSHKTNWSPDSWRNYPVRQQPAYPNETLVSDVLHKISALPPLVVSSEVDRLRKLLADCEQGQRFLLQGGDCAERFADCYPEKIASKFKILLQMSLVVQFGIKLPVVRVGRIAGQFAKPRSALSEWVDGTEVASYRGDNINDFDPMPLKRIPNPDRMLESYHHSAMTLNFIRALLAGGFADLQRIEHWDLRRFKGSTSERRYQTMVKQVRQALETMISYDQEHVFSKSCRDYFTSHEGLLLGYEQAMTRSVPHSPGNYDLSAHMLWIGDRTRRLGEGHIEFFRGVENPIGVKLGPETDPQELTDILRILNPANAAGKVVLITRLGHKHVKRALPALIEAVQTAGLKGLWCCDPMHGNTVVSEHGLKTRSFLDISQELSDTVSVHQQAGSRLGGVHFELTGDNVTECLGGIEDISEEDLAAKYETYCDPRLNYSQSLEMAFLISRLLA